MNYTSESHIKAAKDGKSFFRHIDIGLKCNKNFNFDMNTNQTVSTGEFLKYIVTNEVVYQELEGLVEVSNDKEIENRDQLKEYLLKTSTIETYSKGHWLIKDDFEELDNWSKEDDVLFLLQPIGVLICIPQKVLLKTTS